MQTEPTRSRYREITPAMSIHKTSDGGVDSTVNPHVKICYFRSVIRISHVISQKRPAQ